MSQSVNQFTELNTDAHPLNTKPNVMTDAVNATLTTKGDNQLILQNLHGNEHVATLTEDYVPLGVTVFNDIAYIVSGKFDTNGDFISGEIGTYPSPNWGGLLGQPTLDPNFFLPLVNAYQPLYNFSTSTNPVVLDNDLYYTEAFRTAQLNFPTGKLIEVEIQPSYDDSVNIIFTDDFNPVRLVNSRFKLDDSGKKAAIADRRQSKDTNTYSDARFGATRLIRQSSKIADLSFLGVSTGGILTAGNYHFYFKYVDSDGALTDLIEQSGTVSIAYNDYGANFNETTSNLVRFRIGNLDKNFSAVKVYYTYSTGGEIATSTVFEILNIYDIISDSIDITIYGSEITKIINKDILNLDYSTIDTVKTITQYNDTLVLGNITNFTENYDYFRDVSLKLKLKEEYKPLALRRTGKGYTDPDKVYFDLGYWAGETYEIAIVYILKDGKGLTPAFPIRGGDNYEGNFSYTNSNISAFGSDGFISNGNSVASTENKLGIYRTNKCREKLLYGANDPQPPYAVDPNNNAEMTSVKYFQVNIGNIANDAFLQANTDGFFFVRKERKKDCLMQGYITKSGFKSIPGNMIITANASYLASTLIPAPASYVETPSGIEMYEGIPGNDSRRYVFYSSDILVDPKLGASLFDSSNKGIMYDPSGIEMYENLGAIINPGGSIWKLEYSEFTGIQHLSPNSPAYPNPNNDNLWCLGVDPASNSVYTFTPITPGSTMLNSTINITFWEKDNWYNTGYSSQITVSVPFTVDISIITTAVGTCQIQPTTSNTGLSINNTNILSFPIAVYNPFTNTAMTWADNQGIFIVIDISGMVITTTAGNTFTCPPGTLIYLAGVLNEQGVGGSISLSSTTRNFLGATTLRNYGFCPVRQTDPGSGTHRINEMKYIGGSLEPLTHDQWSNIIRSDLYTRFEDYVGIKMNYNDATMAAAFNKVYSQVNPPPPAFYNYAATGYIPFYGNTAEEDFVYKIQYVGFRFGVVANIYSDPQGSLNIDNWKGKYNGSDSDQLYYPISKRYRWNQIGSTIDLFRGDCYLNYTYKRYSHGLGISGVPTATDPSVYGAAGFGLKPRGYVFPMVHESNHNTGLRTKQDYSEVETALYGQSRTFWPFYSSIINMRLSRQPESKGYNFGYSTIKGERYYTGLNNRAPSLNINFGNRIMVSAPSVAGNFYNGYTDFSGLNFRDYNKQFGEITKLITHNDSVYCIFETGIGVVPINQRTMVTQETGGVFLDDAKVLAQKMQIISTEYGSDQQFSIIKTDGFVYGVDLSKNKVWRITSAGGQHKLDLISDFAVQTILNEYKARLLSNNLNMLVKTNYDRERNNVIFTYFSEDKGKFNTDIYELVLNPTDPDDGNPNNPIDGDIVTTCPTDMISKPDSATIPAHHASASGQEVSKECCDLIGGYWGPDPTKRDKFLCFAKEPEPTPGNPVPLSENATMLKQRGEIKKEDYFKSKKQPSRSKKPFVPTKPIELFDPLQPIKPTIPISLVGPDGNLIPQFLRKNKIGSLYWNETLQKWISRLSWNPLWTFNLQSNLFSFSGTHLQDRIWQHFSQNVPYCHFYGIQDKFIFEFIIVENASVQKILDNLIIICNRAFPGRISYKLLENDFDYELQDGFVGGVDNGYTELLKQRHEITHVSRLGNGLTNDWNVSGLSTIGGNAVFTMTATNGDPISQEEAERLVGGFVIYAGIIYIIGPVVPNSGVFYNEILDQNGINILGTVPVGWSFSTIDFGIIKQNMEYIEDHLYIEVGKAESQSHIRDKAIRVRFIYEGYDYVTVQAVISKFVHSFG